MKQAASEPRRLFLGICLPMTQILPSRNRMIKITKISPNHRWARSPNFCCDPK